MFETPILFLVFNRPKETALVFEQIRRLKPMCLYVAADGPREDVAGESERCIKVRNTILNGIDWNCDLKTLFREDNLGCGRAVSETRNGKYIRIILMRF
jgi:hypothetical protein